MRYFLEEAHYNLYAYTSKETLDSIYQSIQSEITQDSFTYLETYSLFQRLASSVNNGHTELPFPGPSYGAYAISGGTLFPFEIAFEEGRCLIRKNWSAEQSIPVGTEILGINEKTMDDILAQIYPLVSAEREYFKLAKIELFSFPRFYWLAFGQQDIFKIHLRKNGEDQQVTVKAINLIEGFETKRSEIFAAPMEFRFDQDIAYLKPGGFGGDEEIYQRFIDSAFIEIKQANSTHLVIDLRNHPGGDDSFGNYLVSYFADRPFDWCGTYKVKPSTYLKADIRETRDTTGAFWKAILSHPNGEPFTYSFDQTTPKPEAKQFKGKVYVLVNRQSHSQSTVTAAQIKDYGFGTIVGEETGEYPSLYASIFQYQLPETGIPVNISKAHMIRPNGSIKEEGLLPDIQIRDHLLDEEDEILTKLYEYINQ